jgi:glycosyltransferase involved in cell wall biosynthesis
MPSSVSPHPSPPPVSAHTTAVRVLLAAPSLRILGGQSRQAVLLQDCLKAEPGLQITFVPHDPRLPGPLGWLQRIKYIRTILTWTAYWGLLLARVPRHDVVHVFTASYFSYLLAAVPPLVVGGLCRKTVILNYRSGEAEDHLERWARTALPTLRRAHVIAVSSGYLVEVFRRFGLQARVIPDIVELGRFHFRERRPLRPVFLTSRLLEPLYNGECVLRAFSIIQKRLPDARLTVAGDGGRRRQLEALARDLGLRHVDFTGPVPFERMPALYDAADIYLQAPDLDNTPASLLECFASGLPVVTSDAGGIPFLIRHEQEGLLVPRDDDRALADGALRLLDDPDLARRLASQARLVCDQYTCPRVRAGWLALYADRGRAS